MVMSSGILLVMAISPPILMVIFCVVLFSLQKLHSSERDELTKKLMAKHLTEYQQEKAYTEYYEAKKEEVKSMKQRTVEQPYMTMAELENDPDALEQANNYVESITR